MILGKAVSGGFVRDGGCGGHEHSCNLDYRAAGFGAQALGVKQRARSSTAVNSTFRNRVALCLLRLV
jgi:hypothetical protein